MKTDARRVDDAGAETAPVGGAGGRCASDPSAGVCPICGAAKGRVRFAVTPREAASHFVVAEADPLRFSALVGYLDTLWGGAGCRVVECAKCRACYADPFVAGDHTFYGLAYPRHGYPRDRWEFRRTAKDIRERAGENPRTDWFLLEVGGGEGAFIRQVCPSVFPHANVLCTEYSRNGKAAIEALGIECLAVDLRDLTHDRYRGHFHFVCMFQVVEHMDRLDQMFDQLSWLTRPDGCAFISVPNDRTIDFYETNGCLLDMPPNHISRWNPQAFALIAGRHGWRVTEHAYSPRQFLPLYRRVAIYRYLRAAQVSGTMSNRVAAIKQPRLRRLAQIAVIAGHAIRALPLLRKMRSPDLGDAQWVCLVKTGSFAATYHRP